MNLQFSKKMREILTICFVLSISGILLYLVQKMDIFSPVQSVVQTQQVPRKILNKGTLGKVLKSENLIQPVPGSENTFSLSSPKKKIKNDYFFHANPGGYTGLTSNLKITEKNISTVFPLLSIVVDENDLYDKKRGIIANPFQKGRKWERLAYVSYFESDQLRFFSAAGIRIHGHVSRMSKKKSYRLYFRNELSKGKFPGSIFQDGKSIPFHRMVVHLDRPRDMPFTTNMAFDIAERIGCMIPRIKPVRLFINGEFQGVYWISDQLNKKQWSAHIGNENFSIYRPLAENDHVSKKIILTS